MAKKEESSCTRKCSIIFNILFLVCGLAMVGFGAWIEIDYASFNQALNQAQFGHLFSFLSIALIAVGSVTAVIAFLGCCGTWQRSKCPLVLFIIMMVLLVVAEAAILIFAFLFTNEFQVLTSALALSSIQKDYGGSDATGISVTGGWDFMQATLGCCGYTNGYDYSGSVYDLTDTDANPWPDSCCTLNSGGYVSLSNCRATTDATASYYATGCSSRIVELITTYAPLVGGVAGGVVLIQILGIVFAGKNISNINKRNKVGVPPRQPEVDAGRTVVHQTRVTYLPTTVQYQQPTSRRPRPY